MKIGIIAAVSDNFVIGKDGGIPWSISEDLKRFKKLTSGHSIIMGRKTYESIGRPLPNRTNIVLSSSGIDNVNVVGSLEEALGVAANVPSSHAYIIGGEGVYKEALDIANFMEITEVHKYVEGDAFFPKFDLDVWRETERDNKDGYSFVSYEKR